MFSIFPLFFHFLIHHFADVTVNFPMWKLFQVSSGGEAPVKVSFGADGAETCGELQWFENW